MHESGQTYGNISQGLTDLVNEANRWVYRMFRSNFRWLIFALTKKDDIKSDQNAFQLYTNSYTKVIDNKWLVTENAIHKVNGFSGEKMVGPNKPVGTASPLDPANDGAEIVNGVAERVRRELLRNMNLADLLRPSPTKAPAKKASWRSDRIAREEEIKRFHRIGTALFRHWNVDSNGKHKPIIVTDPRL